MPPALPGDGAEALEYARKQRWEGVIAKKRDSTYQPGRRSSSWIKDKIWNTQEVVIGGWRAGRGRPRPAASARCWWAFPTTDGLQFVGRVGTGFTEKDLAKLKEMLKPLHTDESPFNARLSTQDAKGVTFVQTGVGRRGPLQRANVDGRLRQPSWRGLRPDKAPDEVVWE